MLSFQNDYSEGAHPQVLQALIDTNLVQTVGYGMDEYCESAKAKIRAACQAPDAEVFLLTGGTQLCNHKRNRCLWVIKAMILPMLSVMMLMQAGTLLHSSLLFLMIIMEIGAPDL